jgi:hypothetical protein
MRKLFLLLVLIGPLMMISCNDDNGNPADTTNPEITILQPSNGGNVPAAAVLIQARATDNRGIAKVEFYIDGTKLGEDETGAANVYEYTWNATGAAAGSHTIRARAIDASGNDQDATIAVTITTGGGPTYHSDNITSDETWHASGNPHIVTGAIGVGNGDGGRATLTIEPGCIVKFEADADAGIGCGWVAAGSIVAVGTPTLPILFTSNATVPRRGDWRGLSFFDGTMTTAHFSYCTIEYTGYDAGAALYVAWGAVVRMDHCTIRQGAGPGISYEHAGHVEQFNNNTITTCAGYPLETEPEYARHLGTGNNLVGNDPGKDKVMLYDGVVVTSGTWRSQGVPFEVAVVNEGGGIWVTPTAGTPAILTIDAGTTIRFSRGAQLMVGHGGSTGGLIAVGTALSPVTFTSASDAPQPGDWQQINFADGSVDGQCRLEHCVIEYGGRGTYGNVMVVDALPTILRCSIGNGSSYGIYLAGGEYPDAGSLEANNTFYSLVGENVHVEP